MNVQIIIHQLKKRYPSKNIIVTDPSNPGEIICETEPTESHPDWSEAIAVIDFTRLHYHRKLTETYDVLSGQLEIVVQKKTSHLNSGDSITIPPNTRHKAFGRETWIRVTSTPGWTPEDHILVIDKKEASRRDYDTDTS